MSKLIMGEMDEFYKYLISLDEDEIKYFLYLMKHGFEFNVIKDYVSRLKRIREDFGDDFIKNKSYNNIPGSRNYIALNGRYILSKHTIELIKKDIDQIYSFNKRVSTYNEIEAETVCFNMENFMMFMLDKGYRKIEENSIFNYLETLNQEEKIDFIKSIKKYNEIKKIGFDETKLNIIYDKVEEEINAAKIFISYIEEIKKLQKRYPSLDINKYMTSSNIFITKE